MVHKRCCNLIHCYSRSALTLRWYLGENRCFPLIWCPSCVEIKDLHAVAPYIHIYLYNDIIEEITSICMICLPHSSVNVILLWNSVREYSTSQMELKKHTIQVSLIQVYFGGHGTLHYLPLTWCQSRREQMLCIDMMPFSDRTPYCLVLEVRLCCTRLYIRSSVLDIPSFAWYVPRIVLLHCQQFQTAAATLPAS